jgi:DNA-binding Xre family transcriptional regulator
MPKEKDNKTWEARWAAKQQRESVRLEGLWACRVAVALTQRELGKLVGSSQTTIADLERWDKADSRMLELLCRELKVAPEDLIIGQSVGERAPQEGQDGQTGGAFEEERNERRRQVNLIKRGAYYGGNYSGLFPGYPPGTVLLRGMKDCRVAAGLTQRKLAEMIGTNQSTIQQLEQGSYRAAYMSTVKKLCRALEVSPADVICKGSVERGGDGR